MCLTRKRTLRDTCAIVSFTLPTNINLRKVDPSLNAEIDPTSVTDFDRHAELEATPSTTMAPTPILVDNKSVEFSVNNPETSQRTRHLDTRYFKIRDYIRDLSIRVRHIKTDVNVADFFTKALSRIVFQQYRAYLGMEDHAP